MQIEFTQYLRPNGRKQTIYFETTDSVMFEKAEKIRQSGFHFECEELATGMVSLTIGDEDGDYAYQICQNGPEVPDAVKRLVMEFEGKPQHAE